MPRFQNVNLLTAGAAGVRWNGGAGVVAVRGSGTMNFQCSFDGGANWIVADATRGVFTDSTTSPQGFTLPDCLIRINGGTPTFAMAYSSAALASAPN